ncbi:MAG: HPP family protein [Desulfovibrionaceae bacterium]|nr:HPP family protein [Desulfovibrionaceae bacterium]
MNYFQKMRGGGTRPPRAGASEILLSWLGAAIAIALIGLLDHALMDPLHANLLIGSFGASAVLAFGAIRSPLAQPRNLVGGHVVSAFVGVTCASLLPSPIWLTAALAVATAIALMHMTETLHPPGGATALIAVIGGEQVRALGYTYVFLPCLLGSCIMLLLAVLFNNLAKNRKYPLYWW